MRSLEESMSSLLEDLERERGATGGYKSEMEETVQKIAAVQAYEVELERRVREKSQSIEELNLESAAARQLLQDSHTKVYVSRGRFAGCSMPVVGSLMGGFPVVELVSFCSHLSSRPKRRKMRSRKCLERHNVHCAKR
jgi:hypothetical protein